ncbi:MAG: hypothetical protein J5449_13630, partial [Oscillospiraceae bacterium]|nr:hypothetical protein [Oscillospiraceae bacterium]
MKKLLIFLQSNAALYRSADRAAGNLGRWHKIPQSILNEINDGHLCRQDVRRVLFGFASIGDKARLSLGHQVY